MRRSRPPGNQPWLVRRHRERGGFGQDRGHTVAAVTGHGQVVRWEGSRGGVMWFRTHPAAVAAGQSRKAGFRAAMPVRVAGMISRSAILMAPCLGSTSVRCLAWYRANAGRGAAGGGGQFLGERVAARYGQGGTVAEQRYRGGGVADQRDAAVGPAVHPRLADRVQPEAVGGAHPVQLGHSPASPAWAWVTICRCCSMSR